MKTKTHAFTLIEISIVLIVIGLVIGGVLVGRDLILAAQVRSQIKQIEALNTAVMTFKNKYNCLPGDCQYFGNFDPDYPPSDEGNGNGQIGDVQRLDDIERVNFWYALNFAKLISGNHVLWSSITMGGASFIPGIHSPKLDMPGSGISWAVGGGTVYSNVSGGLWTASNQRFTESVMPNAVNSWFLSTTARVDTLMGVYTAPVIYMLDSKIDDGLPANGSLQVVNGYYQASIWRMYNAPIIPGACLNNSTTPAVYNLQSAAPSLNSVCAILIRTPF